MSVYKVINNYYNDLLNFLAEESLINGDLTKFFNNITQDKKKVIILKLSQMMLKFDTAFKNEINYWASNQNDKKWFLIIYIILIIIFISITLFFLLSRFKELTARGSNMFTKIKTSFSHLIVIEVILTIFIILIVNVNSMRKLCAGQINLLKSDHLTYSSQIFIGSTRDNLNVFFNFIALWKKNPKMSFNSNQYKSLKNDPVYSELLALFSNTNNNVGAETVISSVPITTIIIEAKIYDILNADISKSLITFYNNGDGYNDIKKLINLSSPILMLKEAKRIMAYYKYLGLKKTIGDNNDFDEKTKNVVNEVIISPIITLINDFSNINSDISDSDLVNAVSLNTQNTNFNTAMANLIQAFNYLAIFCYPIYIKVSDKDSDFPLPVILNYMPNKINYSTVTDLNQKQLLREIKTEFNRVYDNDYESYIESSKNSDIVDPILNEMLLKLVNIFKELYYNVFLNIKGEVFYPFNQKYIIKAIQENLGSALPGLNLPIEYRIYISKIIFSSIISNVSSNFDIISVKKVFLIESISNSLLLTNINILKFKKYIINTMLEKNRNSKNYIDDVVKIIDQIDISVKTKKEIKSNVDVLDTYKYNDLVDFTDILKTVKYIEFRNGLNVDFFQDLVSKFYSNISDAVNSNYSNMNNIYYERRATFHTWNVTIIMVIIGLILFLIKYLIEIIDEKSYVIYITPVDKNCPKKLKLAQNDYKNRYTNWLIKLIVPPFILLFIIALLIAYKKKMKDVFDFNLEIIETNTNELKILLGYFASKLKEIDDKLDINDKTKQIQLITQITDDDKKDLLELITKVIDKFDKCNYIIEAAKDEVPFPYTELILNGFFMSVAILCIIYVLVNYAPIKRFKDNKYFYKLKEELLITENLNMFNQKLESLRICHNEEMDGLVLSLKIIVFVFIIMFLLFYSVKILTSANDFKNGLFNSFYYEKSIVYDVKNI
jgi:hypothetical protein